MNNQHKYIITGGFAALGILVLLNAFSTFGDNSNFWLLIIATIATSMVLLVTNIFITTKTIAQKAVVQPKKQDIKNA